MPPGFSGNLIFAIIARMLCGNHLKCFYSILKHLTSKGLALEGFTTFMDCCLTTRANNVVRNEVDYLGDID